MHHLYLLEIPAWRSRHAIIILSELEDGQINGFIIEPSAFPGRI
jgi:hypothetical protein